MSFSKMILFLLLKQLHKYPVVVTGGYDYARVPIMSGRVM